MEGSEIFFTITEWPLTAVATDLVLIRQSVNNLEIALDTVPESTIIESTTMSEASASNPRCATSICPPFFFNSTALMLEEPTSRPTIVFDPIPNMCPPFRVARAPSPAFFCSASVPLALRFNYCDPAAFPAALTLRFAPNSIWLDFSSIHWSSFDFLNRQRLPSLNAGMLCSPTYLYSVSGLTPRYCDACRMFITSRESAIFPCVLSSKTPAFCGPQANPGRRPHPLRCPKGFRCPEHISARKNPALKRVCCFCRVLYWFSRKRRFAGLPMYLYIVVFKCISLLAVVVRQVVISHLRTDNRSTRDGTEVLYLQLKFPVVLGLRNNVKWRRSRPARRFPSWRVHDQGGGARNGGPSRGDCR